MVRLLTHDLLGYAKTYGTFAIHYLPPVPPFAHAIRRSSAPRSLQVSKKTKLACNDGKRA